MFCRKHKVIVAPKSAPLGCPTEGVRDEVGDHGSRSLLRGGRFDRRLRGDGDETDTTTEQANADVAAQPEAATPVSERSAELMTAIEEGDCDALAEIAVLSNIRMPRSPTPRQRPMNAISSRRT